MNGSETTIAIKCANCGGRVEVPANFQSLEGRTAKCPRCGHVNSSVGPSEWDPTTVKDQQLIRRI